MNDEDKVPHLNLGRLAAIHDAVNVRLKVLEDARREIQSQFQEYEERIEVHFRDSGQFKDAVEKKLQTLDRFKEQLSPAGVTTRLDTQEREIAALTDQIRQLENNTETAQAQSKSTLAVARILIERLQGGDILNEATRAALRSALNGTSDRGPGPSGAAASLASGAMALMADETSMRESSIETSDESNVAAEDSQRKHQHHRPTKRQRRAAEDSRVRQAGPRENTPEHLTLRDLLKSISSDGDTDVDARRPVDDLKEEDIYEEETAVRVALPDIKVAGAFGLPTTRRSRRKAQPVNHGDVVNWKTANEMMMGMRRSQGGQGRRRDGSRGMHK